MHLEPPPGDGLMMPPLSSGYSPHQSQTTQQQHNTHQSHQNQRQNSPHSQSQVENNQQQQYQHQNQQQYQHQNQHQNNENGQNSPNFIQTAPNPPQRQLNEGDEMPFIIPPQIPGTVAMTYMQSDFDDLVTVTSTPRCNDISDFLFGFKPGAQSSAHVGCFHIFYIYIFLLAGFMSLIIFSPDSYASYFLSTSNGYTKWDDSMHYNDWLTAYHVGDMTLLNLPPLKKDAYIPQHYPTWPPLPLDTSSPHSFQYTMSSTELFLRRFAIGQKEQQEAWEREQETVLNEKNLHNFSKNDKNSQKTPKNHMKRPDEKEIILNQGKFITQNVDHFAPLVDDQDPTIPHLGPNNTPSFNYYHDRTFYSLPAPNTMTKLSLNISLFFESFLTKSFWNYFLSFFRFVFNLLDNYTPLGVPSFILAFFARQDVFYTPSSRPLQFTPSARHPNVELDSYGHAIGKIDPQFLASSLIAQIATSPIIFFISLVTLIAILYVMYLHVFSLSYLRTHVHFLPGHALVLVGTHLTFVVVYRYYVFSSPFFSFFAFFTPFLIHIFFQLQHIVFGAFNEPFVYIRVPAPVSVIIVYSIYIMSSWLLLGDLLKGDAITLFVIYLLPLFTFSYFIKGSLELYSIIEKQQEMHARVVEAETEEEIEAGRNVQRSTKNHQNDQNNTQNHHNNQNNTQNHQNNTNNRSSSPRLAPSSPPRVNQPSSPTTPGSFDAINTTFGSNSSKFDKKSNSGSNSPQNNTDTALSPLEELSNQLGQYDPSRTMPLPVLPTKLALSRITILLLLFVFSYFCLFLISSLGIIQVYLIIGISLTLPSFYSTTFWTLPIAVPKTRLPEWMKELDVATTFGQDKKQYAFGERKNNKNNKNDEKSAKNGQNGSNQGYLNQFVNGNDGNRSSKQVHFDESKNVVDDYHPNHQNHAKNHTNHPKNHTNHPKNHTNDNIDINSLLPKYKNTTHGVYTSLDTYNPGVDGLDTDSDVDFSPNDSEMASFGSQNEQKYQNLDRKGENYRNFDPNNDFRPYPPPSHLPNMGMSDAPAGFDVVDSEDEYINERIDAIGNVGKKKRGRIAQHYHDKNAQNGQNGQNNGQNGQNNSSNGNVQNGPNGDDLSDFDSDVDSDDDLYDEDGRYVPEKDESNRKYYNYLVLNKAKSGCNSTVLFLFALISITLAIILTSGQVGIFEKQFDTHKPNVYSISGSAFGIVNDYSQNGQNENEDYQYHVNDNSLTQSNNSLFDTTQTNNSLFDTTQSNNSSFDTTQTHIGSSGDTQPRPVNPDLEQVIENLYQDPMINPGWANIATGCFGHSSLTGSKDFNGGTVSGGERNGKNSQNGKIMPNDLKLELWEGSLNDAKMAQNVELNMLKKLFYQQYHSLRDYIMTHRNVLDKNFINIDTSYPVMRFNEIVNAVDVEVSSKNNNNNNHNNNKNNNNSNHNNDNNPTNPNNSWFGPDGADLIAEQPNMTVLYTLSPSVPVLGPFQPNSGKNAQKEKKALKSLGKRDHISLALPYHLLYSLYTHHYATFADDTGREHGSTKQEKQKYSMDSVVLPIRARWHSFSAFATIDEIIIKCFAPLEEEEGGFYVSGDLDQKTSKTQNTVQKTQNTQKWQKSEELIIKIQLMSYLSCDNRVAQSIILDEDTAVLQRCFKQQTRIENPVMEQPIEDGDGKNQENSDSESENENEDKKSPQEEKISDKKSPQEEKISDNKNETNLEERNTNLDEKNNDMTSPSTNYPPVDNDDDAHGTNPSDVDNSDNEDDKNNSKNTTNKNNSINTTSNNSQSNNTNTNTPQMQSKLSPQSGDVEQVKLNNNIYFSNMDLNVAMRFLLSHFDSIVQQHNRSKFGPRNGGFKKAGIEAQNFAPELDKNFEDFGKIIQNDGDDDLKMGKNNASKSTKTSKNESNEFTPFDLFRTQSVIKNHISPSSSAYANGQAITAPLSSYIMDQINYANHYFAISFLFLWIGGLCCLLTFLATISLFPNIKYVD